MSFRYTALVGRRLRMQRLKDAKFFGGWVEQASEGRLVLRCPDSERLAVDDQFRVEIYAEEKIVSLQSTVSSIESPQVLLSFSEEPAERPSTEASRLLVHSCPGTLAVEGTTLNLELHNVSPDGAGALVDRVLKRGAQGQLHADTPAGAVDAEIEVRYCRADAEMFGMYRIGIRINSMGRIERARLVSLASGTVTPETEAAA